MVWYNSCMIRSCDVLGFDPTITYSKARIGGASSEAEWKRSWDYVVRLGPLCKKIAAACSLVNKIAYLECSKPLTATIKTALKPVAVVCKIESIYKGIAKHAAWIQKRDLHCDLHSTKKVLGVVDTAVELATWAAMVDRLRRVMRVAAALPSISLTIALLSPALDLVIHLRKEGWGALSQASCHKNAYKVGLALLSIYLFMASVTLSAQLDLILSGVNFALLFV